MITNEGLSEKDLPPPFAAWGLISRFAGSFSGYASKGGLESLAEFARGVRARYEASGELPSDVSDLRSALFYEQRSDHFSNSASDPATLAYIHALVERLRSLVRQPSSGGVGSDPVAACLPEVAEHLLSASLPTVDGDMSSLRERHLLEAVRAAVTRQLQAEVVSTVIPLPEWPRLGQSTTDFVVRPSAPSRRGRHVGELKWCQLGQDKVYEGIWDLFKMALATRIRDVLTAHLITAAPSQMWPQAFCADLFAGGTFAPEELCARRFAVGGMRLAWDYLLEGGYDRYPDRVPAQIATTPACDPVPLEAGGKQWELRAVKVTTVGDIPDVQFPGGWPNGSRPADARRPADHVSPP